jgi:putative transposase
VSKTGSDDFGAQEIKVEFSETVHIEGPVTASIQTCLPGSVKPDITLVAGLLTFSGDIPDDRAQWHHNYTPIETWMAAHVVREVNDWSIKHTADRLADERDLPEILGFWPNDPQEDAHAVPPSYTQLRDIWEETFTARHRGAIIVIAERLVKYCREHGFPAPEDVFLPEDDVEAEEPTEDDPTVRELTTEKTADVWEHARPMVMRHWYLKRHHNWQIPESTFYDGHAALATASDDVFPESGLGNMLTKSNHDRVHFPSTHRRELKKFTIKEIRELHQSMTRDLIKEARREGELVGKMKVAIDQTKGHPWTGEVERNADGSNAEDWILGYKNDNDTRTQYYFQWATIQVVGLDVPLILDAIPVKRGMTKGEIVDELIATANELLHDPEIVMMDAGFDSEAAKNAAEKHSTYYLNKKSRDSDDKKRMRKMWENRETVRIVEAEDRPEMPTRKKIYVPHVLADEENGGEDDGASELRQELLSDFEEAGGDELPDQSPFDSLIDDIREEEQGLSEGDIDGAEQYVVFETNHPLANKRGGRNRETTPEEEQIHAAARMVRNYGNRWGIENGYKKVGHFLLRSGSKDPVLRFFGFAFAATLYNCWRLVDLLVKLSVEDDPDYTPLVTASRFLAVAESMFGLRSKPPPD